jgi:uncharacterized membrane protein
MQNLIYYIVTLLSVAVIDGVWLFFVANNFYKNELGNLMSRSPVWGPAIAFYLLYPAALVVFALIPGIEAKSLMKSVLLAGFLGCVAYATYDLTNWATIAGWSWKVSVVDIIWGTVMSAVVTAISYLILTWK